MVKVELNGKELYLNKGLNILQSIEKKWYKNTKILFS